MKIEIKNPEFFVQFVFGEIEFEFDYLRNNEHPEQEVSEIEKILQLIEILRQMNYLDMPLDELNPDNTRDRLIYSAKMTDTTIGNRYLILKELEE